MRRLSAPQELFVENLVTGGATYILERAGDEIGYVITNSGNQIIELYIEDSKLSYAGHTLDLLVKTLGIRSILAQSFDPLLMWLGLTCDSPAVTRGLLYRVIADPSHKPRSDIIACSGTSEDIVELASQCGVFFDDMHEINAYLTSDGLRVYRLADGKLIGAGVLKPVIDGIDGVDIGMVVTPHQRRRGYGAYIVQHLKAHCLTKGWQPICGCDITNVASQRTLERGGFASMHRLVSFAVGQGSEM